MEFLFRMYGVSRCMCYVRMTYVWRMKRTRDVSTTFVLRSILICGESVLYQLLFIAPSYSRVRYKSPNFRPSVRQHLRRTLVFPTSVIHVTASMKPCIVVDLDIPFKHAHWPGALALYVYHSPLTLLFLSRSLVYTSLH